MYASLYQVREYLRPQTTVEDGLLLRLIMDATRMIDHHQQGRVFEPWYKVLYHDMPTGADLRLTEDLLELKNVWNGNGSLLTADKFLIQFSGLYPKMRLRLLPPNSWYPRLDTETKQAIPVEGIWGWHEDYDHAWVDSLDVCSGLSFGDSSMLVSDVNGTAEDFGFPRFQVGQLLKLADDDAFEFVRVREIIDNSLLLLRARNGTLARDWPSDTRIYIWRGEAVIATCELVRVLYHQSATNLAGIQQIMGTGIRMTPQGFPDHVAELLPAPRMI